MQQIPSTLITDSTGGTASSTNTLVATTAKSTVAYPIPANSGLANSQNYAFMPGFAGQLIGIAYKVGVPVTTGSKLATLTAQVNGSNVTGGVVSLTSAGMTPTGTNIAGTAITGSNTFTNAQTIGFAVSSVTAFVEGSGTVELTVLDTDFANAMSTIVLQLNTLQAAIGKN